MNSFVLPLADLAAKETNRFGPKAANLAALVHSNIPTPGGFAVDANAYREQMHHLNLWEAAKGVFGDDDHSARRHANRIRIALLDEPIKKEIQDQVNDIHLKKFNAKPQESICQGCDYKNVCSFKSEIK